MVGGCTLRARVARCVCRVALRARWCAPSLRRTRTHALICAHTMRAVRRAYSKRTYAHVRARPTTRTHTRTPPARAGGVPAHRQDLCPDHEHRGRDQGLDAHLLLLLPVRGAPHCPQPRGLRLLLLRGEARPLLRAARAVAAALRGGARAVAAALRGASGRHGSRRCCVWLGATQPPACRPGVLWLS